MNDNPSNIHRAVNISTLSDKEIKKYSLVKIGYLFEKNDYILLYDNQYVKIGEARSESTRLNSSHTVVSRMPSSA